MTSGQPAQSAVGVDQADETTSADHHNEDEELTIDAALIAPGLGLAPGAFMAAIKRGVIHQLTERGTDEDAGRYRVTFRYRTRRCQVIVNPKTGVLVQG